MAGLKTYEFKISKKLHGQRIDLVMVELGLPLSRRKIRKVIDIGGVYLNKKRLRVASRQVQAGDSLRIHYHEDNLSARPKKLEWKLSTKDILYRSKDLVALNKPPGLASQATLDQSIAHAETILAKFLESKFGDRGPLTLLHRLDRETSGILLFARNPETTEWITNQFRERTIKKRYLALCYGQAQWAEKDVECNLSPIDQRLGVVRTQKNGGKYARTIFRNPTYSTGEKVSLVNCFPETGRSHQIRKHLETINHAIVGDKRYGPGPNPPLSTKMSELSRSYHFLHAVELDLTASRAGKRLSIIAPPPPNFYAAVDLAKLTLPPNGFAKKQCNTR